LFFKKNFSSKEKTSKVKDAENTVEDNNSVLMTKGILNEWGIKTFIDKDPMHPMHYLCNKLTNMSFLVFLCETGKLKFPTQRIPLYQLFEVTNLYSLLFSVLYIDKMMGEGEAIINGQLCKIQQAKAIKKKYYLDKVKFLEMISPIINNVFLQQVNDKKTYDMVGRVFMEKYISRMCDIGLITLEFDQQDLKSFQKEFKKNFSIEELEIRNAISHCAFILGAWGILKDMYEKIKNDKDKTPTFFYYCNEKHEDLLDKSELKKMKIIY
jgi:uncharacterized protein YjgD (DUF1641 family)